MKLTSGEKTFFAIVALSALWVGSWAYIAPAHVQNGIPWFAPPLHASVIGAAYLSAFVFCLMSAFARSYAQIRIVLPMIAIWTAVILVVSLFHLTGNDYAREPVWIWIGAHVIYPVIALWVMWVHIGVGGEAGAAVPMWARVYFLLQGLLLIAAGAVLLALPAVMARIWPWELTPQLAHIYAGPVLCYGVASVKLARAWGYADARIPIAGMLVFALAVLAASGIHRDIFAGGSVSETIWLAGFAIAVVVHGFLLIRAWRSAAATS